MNFLLGIISRVAIGVSVEVISMMMKKDWTRRAYLHQTPAPARYRTAGKLGAVSGIMRDGDAPYRR